MNATAVILGVAYGLAAAGAGYVVSMVASGLFARAFYRIYARVLIGISAIMLFAPLLHWAAKVPVVAQVLLTAAGYAAVLVLGYGVVRFNREFMKTVFLERQLTAYFTFGTLANAALVTLVFLHVAVAVGSSRAGTGLSFGPWHYGPLVMLVAAMIFHTDYYLKLASKESWRFGRFTFVGYAVSFVAVLLSVLPYFGQAFSALGLGGTLSTGERAFLENFSCAQTLLLAIAVFGAMVWYLESVPPLYLLLLAFCGEYHVLVTQWFIRSELGPSSWALAALPLFVGMHALARYFVAWDRQRREREAPEGGIGEVAAESIGRPRFVVPFRVVTLGLAVLLVAVTFWTRFVPVRGGHQALQTSLAWPDSPPAWFLATMLAYAGYFFVATVLYKDHRLIYAGALAAGMGALFGVENPAGPGSAVELAVLSALLAALARVGEWTALRREYRTAATDSALVAAALVLLLVLCRHVVDLGGAGPYGLHFVSGMRGRDILHAISSLDAPALVHGIISPDAVGLVFAIFALVVCGRQYRSRLPMYLAVACVLAIWPTMSAGSSFLACLVAEIVRRRVPRERGLIEEERLEFLGRFPLPRQLYIPELYARPLTGGAVPLSILGLAVSAVHILGGDLSVSALLGAATSAVVLGLITRTYRFEWLFVLSLLSGYFAIHSIAHSLFFEGLKWPGALAGHLAVASVVSLAGWVAATCYSHWCAFWLMRVAESEEAAIRARQLFYAGTLYHVTAAMAVTALALLLVMTGVMIGTPRDNPDRIHLLAAAGILAVFFGQSGAVYRSKLGSYLSLTALGLAVVNLVTLVALPSGTEGTVLAALGCVMAAISAAWWGSAAETQPISTPAARSSRGVAHSRLFVTPWARPPLPLAAVGLDLWLRPLAEFALLFAALGFAHSCWVYASALEQGRVHVASLCTFGLTTLILLLCTRAYRVAALYVLAIGTGYFAAHATAQAILFAGLPVGDLVSQHVLVASALSIAGWAIATAYSASCNFWLRRVAEEEEAAIRTRRAYYAGLLHHVTQVAAVPCLAVLLGLTIVDFQAVGAPWGVHLASGVTLATFFALSAGTYRSRVQSYLSLAAVCLALYGLVGMNIQPTGRGAYDGAALATLALVFGLASWAQLRLVRAPTQEGEALVCGLPSAWERPPLPWVATGPDLWARSLAEVSLVVGLLAVAHALLSWGPATRGWNLLAFYLVSAVWLLGTGTYRLGVLRAFVRAGGTVKAGESGGELDFVDRLERTALYVLAIGMGYFALQATAQTLFFEPRVTAAVFSGHILVAASIFTLGWAIATAYAAWCNALLHRVAKEEEGPVRDRSLFYAGWLHHVTLTLAATDLAVFLIVTVLESSQWTLRPQSTVGWDESATAHPFGGEHGELFAAGVLLGLFFGLSGAVYRSKLQTYMALASLGLAALNLVSVAPLPWKPGGPGDAAALALAAVAMTVLTSGLWRRVDSTTEEVSTVNVPAPWPRGPLPLLEPSLKRLWAVPLTEVALIFAAVAVLLAVVRWRLGPMGNPSAILVTFWSVAAVLVLEARLYRTAVLTYLAPVALWASLYPLLAVADWDLVHSGSAVAVLALLLWGASYVVERVFGVGSPAAGQPNPSVESMAVSGGREPPDQPAHAGRSPDLVAQVPLVGTLDVSGVFERPLARCAGILSVVAIGHSLVFWRLKGWDASHRPLVAACVIGAITLLLSARTMKVLQRMPRARLFVYVACLALAGACVAGGANRWGYHGAAYGLAALSLALATIGLALIESDRSAETTGQGGGGMRRVYGEPMSHCALAFPVLAVFLATIEPFPELAGDLDLLRDPSRLGSATLIPPALAMLAAGLTYLISVRTTRERFWLYPAVILGSLGTLVLIESVFRLGAGTLVLTTVVLMNLLVGLARLMVRHEAGVGSWLGIEGAGCERAFYHWPSAVTAAVVLGQGVYFCLTLPGPADAAAPRWPWPLTSLLACALFFHLFYLERRGEFVHVLIGASLLGLLSVCASSGWRLTPDVAVAILGLFWGVAASGLTRSGGQKVLETLRLPMDAKERGGFGQVVAGWSAGLMVLCLIVSAFTWTLLRPGFPSTGVTLLLVTLGCAAGGYLWQLAYLEPLAAVLFLGSTYATLLFLLPAAQLLPVMALATIVVAAGCLVVAMRLRAVPVVGEPASFLGESGRWMARVSAAFTTIAAAATLLGVASSTHSWPIALAMVLIGLSWLFMAWGQKVELLVYLAEVALAGTYLYVRHGIFEVPFGSPMTPFAVVIMSFLLFGLNILAARHATEGWGVFVRPTYYSALFLPAVLLVLIWPMLASPDQKALASLVIFAAASFYMLVARRDQVLWSMYVAAILFNVGVYVWVPTASDKTGLLQLYVIPAALTVLIFAHLHRGELNRHALNGIRMAASAAILAVSTLEVFFARASLLHFVAVLFLSLLLTGAGVALRVRPFVYIGLAFLVLNVVGQLVQEISSKEGPMRALILIAVGLAVLAGMVFFNIKREQILRQYRQFMADSRWE